MKNYHNSQSIYFPDLRMVFIDTNENVYYGANLMVVPPLEDKITEYNNNVADCYDFTYTVIDPYQSILSPDNGVIKI